MDKVLKIVHKMQTCKQIKHYCTNKCTLLIPIRKANLKLARSWNYHKEITMRKFNVSIIANKLLLWYLNQKQTIIKSHLILSIAVWTKTNVTFHFNQIAMRKKRLKDTLVQTVFSITKKAAGESEPDHDRFVPIIPYITENEQLFEKLDQIVRLAF